MLNGFGVNSPTGEIKNRREKERKTKGKKIEFFAR
jgi:hypothetical protein